MEKYIMFSQKLQKTAFGACESVTQKLNLIKNRNDKLYKYLTEVVDAMQRASDDHTKHVDVRSQELNSLIEDAFERIHGLENQEHVLEAARDVLTDNLTCLKELLQTPEVSIQGDRGSQPIRGGAAPLRHMREVPNVNHDESPCSTFPEGQDDLQSIIAHLNDVVSKGDLPEFGRQALANHQSAARAVCVRNGLGTDWFKRRSDPQYLEYLNDIERGRAVIDVSDFHRSKGNFVYSFFDGHREKMPRRVQDELNRSKKKNVHAISNKTIDQMQGISTSFDVVGITLLCRLVNLLQGGDEDVVAHMFAYVIDKRRSEIGVNRFERDEYDSTLAMGVDANEQRGLDMIADRQGGDRDLDVYIQSEIQNLERQPLSEYNDKAIKILEEFKNQLAIKLDTHISSLKGILDRLSVDTIGAEQMKDRQAAVNPMKNIFKESLGDAKIARDRLIGRFDTLMNVANRGYSIPALTMLKSLFDKKKTAYVNHNHGQIVITTQSGDVNGGIKVLNAIVRVNRADPPRDWMKFAPDNYDKSDLHSLQQSRPKTPSKKEQAKRRCKQLLVHELAPRISSLPFEEKVQQIKDAISSKEMAECMAQLLKDNTNRTVERIPKSGPNAYNLIYEKLQQVVNAFSIEAWRESLTNADPQEQNKLDNALVEAFNKATSRNNDSRDAARVIASLAFSLRPHFISDAETVALINFIGEEPDSKAWRLSGLGSANRARDRMAFIDEEFLVKEAECNHEDVRGCMLKLARSLFLA
jgi:hypothetical protein